MKPDLTFGSDSCAPVLCCSLLLTRGLNLEQMAETLNVMLYLEESLLDLDRGPLSEEKL